MIWKKTYSAILGEKCVGVLEKMFGNFWRKSFGVFGDLENFVRRNRGRRFGEIVRRFWRKPFGDFGEDCSAILEIVMEYRNARRPYAEIES